MNQNKSKKIIVFITHSLGELDVLLPLFSGLKKKYKVEIEFIFLVKKIYKQFLLNKFYIFCTNKLDIKCNYCIFPNKFDFRGGFYERKIGRRLLRIFFLFLNIKNFFILFKKLISADYYMYEFSLQIHLMFFLNIFNFLFKKTNICYHHGHTINIDSNFKINKFLIKKNRSQYLLNFHQHNKKSFEEIGFKKQFFIGYPKFFSEWIDLVNSFETEKIIEKNVIIFTRSIHQNYMTEKNYIYLLSTALKVIKKNYGDIKIIIKPHPRENIDFLKKMLEKNNQYNYQILFEDSSYLSKNSVLAISFWTSAILSSLAMGVPSIEYYIEAAKFREQEPTGSVFKKIGIDSADNERDLDIIIKKIITDGYQLPKTCKEIFQFKNINFLDKV